MHGDPMLRVLGRASFGDNWALGQAEEFTLPSSPENMLVCCIGARKNCAKCNGDKQ